MDFNGSFQVIKFNGKDVIFEVLGDALEDINKVILGFVKYGKDNKKVDGVRIYLSPGDMGVLIKRINSGKVSERCAAMVCKAKEEGKDYPAPGFIRGNMGTAARDGKPCEYRSFAISAAGKVSDAKERPGGGYAISKFVLQASFGPGKTDDKGLITPAGKLTTISVPITADQLLEFADLTDRLLNAHVCKALLCWEKPVRSKTPEGGDPKKQEGESGENDG